MVLCLSCLVYFASELSFEAIEDCTRIIIFHCSQCGHKTTRAHLLCLHAYGGMHEHTHTGRRHVRIIIFHCSQCGHTQMHMCRLSHACRHACSREDTACRVSAVS